MPPSAATASSGAPSAIQMNGRRSANVSRTGPDAAAGVAISAGVAVSAIVIGRMARPSGIGWVSLPVVIGPGSCPGVNA
jgi:hypothetical protein